MTSAQHLKIVVAGRIGSGKTTFVDGIANIDVVSLWNPPRRDDVVEVGRNIRRGPATEVGRLEVDSELTLHLHSVASNLSSIFSIPRGMHGFLVMVDSTDERSLVEGRVLLLYMMYFPIVPCIVVANKQDLPGALSVEQVRAQMRLPDRIPVMPCVATERDSVRTVLLELIYAILDQQPHSSHDSETED